MKIQDALRTIAGTFVLASLALGHWVHPGWYLLTAFVGINQWMYVTLRGCPASVVLRRSGIEPQCHW